MTKTHGVTDGANELRFRLLFGMNEDIANKYGVTLDRNKANGQPYPICGAKIMAVDTGNHQWKIGTTAIGDLADAYRCALTALVRAARDYGGNEVRTRETVDKIVGNYSAKYRVWGNKTKGVQDEHKTVAREAGKAIVEAFADSATTTLSLLAQASMIAASVEVVRSDGSAHVLYTQGIKPDYSRMSAEVASEDTEYADRGFLCQLLLDLHGNGISNISNIAENISVFLDDDDLEACVVNAFLNCILPLRAKATEYIHMQSQIAGVDFMMAQAAPRTAD